MEAKKPGFYQKSLLSQPEIGRNPVSDLDLRPGVTNKVPLCGD